MALFQMPSVNMPRHCSCRVVADCAMPSNSDAQAVDEWLPEAQLADGCSRML